jgi:hypothetical protein
MRRLLWSAAALGLLAGLALYAVQLSAHPPGFTFDESAIALNAHTIATNGEDEFGASWPLFFRSFGDYKGAPYIYLLALVFKVFGTGVVQARMLSAVLGVAAAAVLGVLGARVTRSRATGLVVAGAALLTPWLFENSRFVFEVAAYPLVLATYLLAASRDAWSTRRIVAIGLLLGALTYTYAPGRLLAPLLAAGLLLLHEHRRAVAAVWAVYAVTVLPLLLFVLRHGGALTDYPRRVSYLGDDGSPARDAARLAARWLAAYSPHHLLLSGSPDVGEHAPFLGLMLGGVLALGVVGLVVTVSRARTDRWSRYVLFGLVVAPLPGALTTPVAPPHRLIPLFVFLMLLVAPAVALLLRTPRTQLVLAALLGLAVLQAAAFQVRYREESPARLAYFDAGFPALFERAQQLDGDELHFPDAAYVHARWRRVLEPAPRPRLVTRRGAPVRPGDVAILYFRPCEGCRVVARSGLLVLAAR